MRISSAQFYKAGSQAISRQQSELLELYQKVSTGRRISKPSDDPQAAARLINLSQSISINNRMAENRALARQNMNLEENALTSATELVQQVKTRITESFNGALSDSDRESLSTVIASLKDSMLALANADDGNGRYLFSGYRGDVAPFAASATGAVVWQGDQGQRVVQVSQSRDMRTSDDGMAIFMRAASGDRSYVVSSGENNTGTGVVYNATISDTTGANIGKDFIVEFSGTPAQHTISVMDKSGVLVDGPFGPTIYDPSDKKITLPGGMSLQLSGEPAAGDRFEVTSVQDEDLNIFDTLNQLSAALATPIGQDPAAASRLRNALTEASGKINANYNAILTVRASLGTRLQELDMLDAAGQQQGLIYSTERSRLRDINIAAASTELEIKRSGLEAASLAYKKIQELSLFRINR